MRWQDVGRGHPADILPSHSGAQVTGGYPLLCEQLTVDVIRGIYGPLLQGDVERYEAPNVSGLNFLLHGALDGGGTLSLKTDAQGKVLSTAMLRMEVDVPDDIARLAQAGAGP